MPREIGNLKSVEFDEQGLKMGTLREAYCPDRWVAVQGDRGVVSFSMEERDEFLDRARNVFLCGTAELLSDIIK